MDKTGKRRIRKVIFESGLKQEARLVLNSNDGGYDS